MNLSCQCCPAAAGADVLVAHADVVSNLVQCFQVCPTSGVWPWPDPCSTEPEDGPRQDITAE